MATDYLDDTAVCINLATVRRNGLEVLTPVWYTVIGGRLYLRTGSGFGKTRRIRNTPTVRFATCTFEGTITGDWHAGTARILANDDPLTAVANQKLDEKYGAERERATAMLAGMDETGVYIEVTPDA